MNSTRKRYGGVEAGGTKFVLVVGNAEDGIEARHSLPTTSPEETLAGVIAFFQAQEPISALGIASFGPLVLDPRRADYGGFGKTPKAGWSGAGLVGPLKEALNVPVGLDTDVNGAGLAEAVYGAGRDEEVVVYITVGTGLGGGLIVRGEPVHGLTHPEMGHVSLPLHPRDADFGGVCPFHGTCLEGLVSGPAISARLGGPLSSAAGNDPIWEQIGYYLGGFCATLTLVASPGKIILGGGVMENAALFAPTRAALATALNGYVGHPRLSSDLSDYVVPPKLGSNAGAIGALILADRAFHA